MGIRVVAVQGEIFCFKEEEDKKILLIPDEEIKKDKGNVSVNLQLQFDLHDQLPVGFIAAGGV